MFSLKNCDTPVHSEISLFTTRVSTLCIQSKLVAERSLLSCEPAMEHHRRFESVLANSRSSLTCVCSVSIPQDLHQLCGTQTVDICFTRSPGLDLAWVSSSMNSKANLESYNYQTNLALLPHIYTDTDTTWTTHRHTYTARTHTAHTHAHKHTHTVHAHAHTQINVHTTY